MDGDKNEKEIKVREEKLKEKQEELEKEMKEREQKLKENQEKLEEKQTELHIKGEEQCAKARRVALREEKLMRKELGMKRKYEDLYNNETENLNRGMVEVEGAVYGHRGRNHVSRNHMYLFTLYITIYLAIFHTCNHHILLYPVQNVVAA